MKSEKEPSEKKDLSIINQTRIFEENYELMNVKLGEGCHGDVRKCIHKKNKQYYAVKMIRNGDTEIILSAITSFKIAKNLNHPSIIKPYELFINRETEKICYVMEYCEYGSLQEYIESLWSLSPKKKYRTRPEATDEEIHMKERKKRKKLFQKNIGAISSLTVSEGTVNVEIGENIQGVKQLKQKVQFNHQTSQNQQLKLTKKILKEILLAVSYLHSEGICHRDLKPDNILVSNDLQRIKIIDFEISKQFKFLRSNRSVLKVSEMWTRTGTQDFMSPEMFESTGYTEAVDIWAVGVIAYLLLSGRLPFDQEYISDKIEFIRNAQYNQEYIKDIDEVSKDFIRRMLKKDPNERLTANEALSHPWFLVLTDVEYRHNKDSSLNKSSVISHFHSPQVIEKGIKYDNGAYKDLNLLKGQSTVFFKKEISNDDYAPSTNFKKFNQNHQSLYQSQNLTQNVDKRIVSKKRRNMKHTEYEDDIGSSQIECTRSSYDCEGINQPQEYIIPSSFEGILNKNRDLSLALGVKLFISKEDIDKSEQIQLKSTEIAQKRKQEFQNKLQAFKEQMKSRETDLLTARFIHINQKQRQNPQVSQLRLRLLQEKRERESIQPYKLSFDQNQNLQPTLSSNNSEIRNEQPKQVPLISNLNSGVFTNSLTNQMDEMSQNASLETSSNNGNNIMSQKQQAGIEGPFSPQEANNTFNQSDDFDPMRLRSTTNIIKEFQDTEDFFEGRAKRMSEDFTSSCVIYNQLGQQDSQKQQSNKGPSMTNSIPNVGKVTKVSQFSSQFTHKYMGNNNSLESNSSNQNQIPQEDCVAQPVKKLSSHFLNMGSANESNNLFIGDSQSENKVEQNFFFKQIQSEDEGESHNQSGVLKLNKITSDASSITLNNSDLNQEFQVPQQKANLRNIFQKSGSIKLDSSEQFDISTVPINKQSF